MITKKSEIQVVLLCSELSNKGYESRWQQYILGMGKEQQDELVFSTGEQGKSKSQGRKYREIIMNERI